MLEVTPHPAALKAWLTNDTARDGNRANDFKLSKAKRVERVRVLLRRTVFVTDFGGRCLTHCRATAAAAESVVTESIDGWISRDGVADR